MFSPTKYFSLLLPRLQNIRGVFFFKSNQQVTFPSLPSNKKKTRRCATNFIQSLYLEGLCFTQQVLNLIQQIKLKENKREKDNSRSVNDNYNQKTRTI